MKGTRAVLPPRRKRGEPVHSPLAQDEPDDDNFQDDPQLSFYESDEEWEIPASVQSRLGLPGGQAEDITSNGKSVFDDSKDESEHPDDAVADALGIKYKGKHKKKWKKKEFLEQLEENQTNIPFQGGSLRIVLGVIFTLTVIVFVYVKTSVGGFQFQGLASADDDDYVDDDNAIIVSKDIGSKVPVSSPLDDVEKGGNPAGNPYHFNPDAVFEKHDAFHVSDANWYGGVFSTPPFPSLPSHLIHNHDENLNDNIGYIQYPHIFNSTIVFCSEGDVYLTQLSPSHSNDEEEKQKPLPALRLTSTVGNVNTPHINPKYPYLIAFTATYTGHREVYLMDLRSNHRSKPSMRLTFMDSDTGVLSVAGWEDDGSSLVISSYNMEVAMEDHRLYKIGVVQNNSTESSSNRSILDRTTSSISVSSIQGIPLSQAIDSAYDESTGCRFFTRFKQSSNTARYVGGTAEHLWTYCDGEETALPLTNDFNGTSKSPSIYSRQDGTKYLFFLSDRSNRDGTSWTPTTMNLWYAKLPNKHRLYKTERTNLDRPQRLTVPISCSNGFHVKEYSIDIATGNILLRIGADLQILYGNDIEAVLADNEKRSTLIPKPLPISVYSDFNNLHERIIPVNNPQDVKTTDIFDTGYGLISTLMTARGQVFVNPVIPTVDKPKPFGGGNMNIPVRRYRLAPSSTTAGMTRILGSWYCGGTASGKRSLILATDPLSITAELGFYFIDASSAASVEFSDVNNIPVPFIGGHVNGGSISEGGLGSIDVESVKVSPCGRRVAWTDTDGNIRVMTLPLGESNQTTEFSTIPKINEQGQPMLGIDSSISFSPAGRYLAIEHNARNQFRIISIVDLGDPENGTIDIKRIVQATSDRFNSMNALWGQAPVDFKVKQLMHSDKKQFPSTTLYFLSDRDVILTGNTSPWGTRAPYPYFSKTSAVYALPLIDEEDELKIDPLEEIYRGSYVGQGALEILGEKLTSWTAEVGQADPTSNTTSADTKTNTSNTTQTLMSDIEISLGPKNDTELTFLRRAAIISEIPAGNYAFIHQLKDDPSIIVAEPGPTGKPRLTTFAIGDFPENFMKPTSIEVTGLELQALGVSSNRDFLYFTYSGKTKVITNDVLGFTTLFMKDTTFVKNLVDVDRWSVSVWPQLEYQQMFSDAWRMLRDYYYAKDMGNVDWDAVHTRYLPLVSRCGRREELDDVLKQMAAELSALHVFVYGGEYNDPLFGNQLLKDLNAIASLGAVLERSVAWNGYIVKEIPERDPDFNSLDGKLMYSPLSHKTLSQSGQRGLLSGDVIVSVNGESVMNVPDIHQLLRGMAGRSIRLGVLRVKSKSSFAFSSSARKMEEDPIPAEAYHAEAVIVVPITQEDSANLRYAAWEWKTRKKAKTLANEHGFTVGYMHLRSMSGAEGEDAFVRGLYPDYDKDALIIDVRHNHGGNIDSWLLDSLQRKAWSFWQGRATNITNGGLGWDEQFAFRGHIVVLIDEKTSSDGEGFSRGVSELGVGKLVGKLYLF